MLAGIYFHVFLGDYKENLLHIYAHMLEYAKNYKDFRLPVSEPKIGKVNITSH